MNAMQVIDLCNLCNINIFHQKKLYFFVVVLIVWSMQQLYETIWVWIDCLLKFCFYFGSYRWNKWCSFEISIKPMLFIHSINVHTEYKKNSKYVFVHSSTSNRIDRYICMTDIILPSEGKTIYSYTKIK